MIKKKKSFALNIKGISIFNSKIQRSQNKKEHIDNFVSFSWKKNYLVGISQISIVDVGMCI